MRIPKLNHKIWTGSFFSAEFQSYYLQLIANMPGYQQWLWTDLASLTQDEAEQLRSFVEKNGIQLKEITVDNELENYQYIIFELVKLRIAKNNGGLIGTHAVRLSDLLRMAILKKYGGVYTDSDSQSCAIIPELKSPYGIILNKEALDSWLLQFCEDMRHEYLPDYNGFVSYCFIASIPEHPIIEKSCQIMAMNYKTLLEEPILIPKKTAKGEYDYRQIYANDAFKYEYKLSCKDLYSQFNAVKSKTLQNEITMLLTGTALPLAVNDFISSRHLSVGKAQRLFLPNRQKYILHFFSNSWAVGTEQDGLTAKKLDLEANFRSFALLLQERRKKLNLKSPTFDQLKLAYGLFSFIVFSLAVSHLLDMKFSKPNPIYVSFGGLLFLRCFNVLYDFIENAMHEKANKQHAINLSYS